MTLLTLTRILEAVALQQPSVKTVVENDVFRLNSLPNVDYGVFAWTQGTHTGNPDSGLRRFAFTLFYVDRLRTDQRNQIEVQSVGVDTLANIIKIMCDDYDAEVADYQVTTFNQRFADECAGAFATVLFDVPADGFCTDEIPGDYNLDFGPDFWRHIV